MPFSDNLRHRVLSALLLVLAVCRAIDADDRPNIIVFYTDDHGYSDTSCQGVFDDIRTRMSTLWPPAGCELCMVTARLRNACRHEPA